MNRIERCPLEEFTTFLKQDQWRFPRKIPTEDRLRLAGILACRRLLSRSLRDRYKLLPEHRQNEFRNSRSANCS